MKVAAV